MNRPRVGDPDAFTGNLTVVQALSFATYQQPVLRKPKATKSRRRVPFTDDLARELLHHTESVARVVNPLNLVFPSIDGGLIHPNNWSKKDFKAALARAGLPPTVRLYDLRHSMATLALEAGVHPKVVSERLGHSTTQLTLDTYSHVTPHMQDRASESLGRLIYGASAGSTARPFN